MPSTQVLPTLRFFDVNSAHANPAYGESGNDIIVTVANHNGQQRVLPLFYPPSPSMM